MNLNDDGGPAFPVTINHFGFIDGAMTLRDYFAAKAMSGMLANPGGPIQANDGTGWGWCNCTAENTAGLAYEIAIAMLAARKVV